MNRTLTPKTTLYLVCTTASLWMILFFYMLVSTHTPGPKTDDWDFIYFTEQIEAGTHTLNDWIEQYYGIHRVVFPKLLFYLEYEIFHGEGVFTTILSLLLLGGSIILVVINLFELDIKNNTRLFMVLVGILLVFNPTMLYVLNLPIHSLIRAPIVFILFLSVHLLARDYRQHDYLSYRSVIPSIILASCTLFSDASGVFFLAGIMIALFFFRTAMWLRAVSLITFVIVVYYSLPGDIILHIDTGTLTLTKNEILKKIHQEQSSFFPNYFIYLFGYFGAITSLFSATAGLIIGALFFCICGAILAFTIIKKETKYFFFSVTLLILFVHAAGISLGRYQDTSYEFSRYYIFYCWILWIMCIYFSRLELRKKYLYYPAFIILFSYSSWKQAINQYTIYISTQKADINVINGSFYHDAYYKVGLPHMMVNYNPVLRYDQYLRERKWGLYSKEIHPALDNLSTDQCEAIKTHEFIVSEKMFYELKLDGWNITKNRYLSDVYAINSEGKVISTGKSLPKESSLLPLSMLPREKIQIYMIIPRQYPLRDITFVGGDDNSLCKIRIIANSGFQKIIH